MSKIFVCFCKIHVDAVGMYEGCIRPQKAHASVTALHLAAPAWRSEYQSRLLTPGRTAAVKYACSDLILLETWHTVSVIINKLSLGSFEVVFCLIPCLAARVMTIWLLLALFHTLVTFARFCLVHAENNYCNHSCKHSMMANKKYIHICDWMNTIKNIYFMFEIKWN